MLSPDDRTLYVTNYLTVVAFDVLGPGRLANRRDFSMLKGSTSGDGSAVDAAGRLYVTSGHTVQVFSLPGRASG